jgi:hypothetical protein
MAATMKMQNGAPLIPRLYGYIEAPAPLLSSARFKRIHNQALKKAVRTVLRYHHRRRIPKHFRPDAKYKYDHKRRTGRTNKLKRIKTGQAIDLIKSSRTRQRMTRMIDNIRVGGSAAKHGSVVGRMTLSFPFPVRSRNEADSRTVTMRDMMQEIEAWNIFDQEQAGKELIEEYTKELFALLNSSPKMRKAYKAAMAAGA